MVAMLPPLNALRAFEVTARHLSFSRGAEELHVTPAALSHQIKGLEDFLGVKLFIRKTRSIQLTDAGRMLYPGLHSGFGQMRQAVATLDRVRNERVLVISSPPGLTAKWLTPRLYRFLAENPDIDARISSTAVTIDFGTAGIDVAIRNARTDVAKISASELTCDNLVGVNLLPVVSPRYLEQFGEINTPQDLARAALIFDESFISPTDLPTWRDWFEKAGVSNVDLSRGLRFNSADHALDAAVEGAGVLLATYAIAYDELRHGKLVCPINIQLEAPRAFHFVCPKGHEARPIVAAFRDWLQREMGAMRACPVDTGVAFNPAHIKAPVIAPKAPKAKLKPAQTRKKAAKQSRSK